MRILHHPDPALRVVASTVDPRNDPGIRSLVADMAREMYDAPGIGLAATQIGVPLRVVVYDLEEDLTVICNPVLSDPSVETEEDEEGCLSLPGLAVPVTRSVEITCDYIDLDGTAHQVRAEGLFARMLQHEVDHLDGILMIDRAEPEARREALRRYDPLSHC